MFSEAIDEIIDRTGRTALRSKLVSYMNSTIRECILRMHFDKDLVETSVTATIANYVWTAPRHMRTLRTIKYPDGTFPKRIQPGRKQIGETSYYYFASNYIVFQGSAINDVLTIAYYLLNKRLLYYAADERPAIFDRDTEVWTYLSAGNYISTLGSESLDEAARAKVHHWLLDIWLDLILEGTMAKFYKFLSDEKHQLTTYALYKDRKSVV